MMFSQLSQKPTQYHWRVSKRKKHVVTYCAAMMFLLGGAPLAMAAPTDGVVTSGSGSIARLGNNTNINQASQRLDINWGTFSTQANEAVNFYQPNSTSVAINRVVGGVPSQLRGALNANGRVFLLNNAGITFYGSSQVNVGALVASTAKDVKIDGDKYTFIGQEGEIINQGNITVSDGGFAVLAAPSVQNEGVIQANLGEVDLAASPAVTVDLRGDNLVTFAVTPETAQKLGASNTGSITAKSGTVNITSNQAADIVSSAINLGGVVDVSSFDGAQDAGNVTVKSAGDITNTANIKADGGVSGNGGNVVTYASGTNNFAKTATISAKGGSVKGDGGFVDVSGKKVILNGQVNTTAAKGKSGTLYIDPDFLKVVDVGGASDTVSSEVSEEWVENQSQSNGSVTLEAVHGVTLGDLSDGELTGGSGDITLQTTDADGYINFEDKNDTIRTTTGNITLSAGSGGINVGNLTTAYLFGSPGKISLTTTNGGDINTRNLTVIGSADTNVLSQLDVNAAGSLTVNGDINVSADAEEDFGVRTAQAHVTLNAGTNVTLGNTILAVNQAFEEEFNFPIAEGILTINAGNGESVGNISAGNITVNVDALVPENEEVQVSTAANATATATLNANGTIHLANTTVSSDASSDDFSGAAAIATSLLNVGNSASLRNQGLTINGDTTVYATVDNGATSNGGVGNAAATANLHSDGNVVINGDTDVGTDTFLAADAGLNISRTSNAGLTISASDGNEETANDVTITGDAHVHAFGDGDSYDNNNSHASQALRAFMTMTAERDVTRYGDALIELFQTNDNNGVQGRGNDVSRTIITAGRDVLICGNTTTAVYEEGVAGSVIARTDITGGNDVGIRGNTRSIAQVVDNFEPISDESEFPNQGTDVTTQTTIEAMGGSIIAGGDVLSVSTYLGEKIDSDATLDKYIALSSSGNFPPEDQADEREKNSVSAIVILNAPNGDTTLYTDREPLALANDAFYQDIVSGSVAISNSISERIALTGATAATLLPEEDCPICVSDTPQPEPTPEPTPEPIPEPIPEPTPEPQPGPQPEVEFIPYEPVIPVVYVPGSLSEVEPAAGDSFCDSVNVADPADAMAFTKLCKEESIEDTSDPVAYK